MLTGLLVKSKRWLLSGSLGLLLFSCTFDSPIEVPPQGEVAVVLDLNSDASDLRSPLGYVVVTKPRLVGEHTGHQGIVVVNGLVAGSGESHISQSFMAYDLACPNDWPSQVRLVVAPSQEFKEPIATCPRCHETYKITMGTGMSLKPEGKSAMISYRVYREGDRLIIRNR